METINLYKSRRSRLAQNFSRTLFVIPSGTNVMRSHSVGYRFKVASDFYYLSGLKISDGILIIAGDRTYLLKKFDRDRVWGEFTDVSSEEQTLLKDISVESTLNLQNLVAGLSHQFDQIAFSLGRDFLAEEAVLSAIAFKRRSGHLRGSVLGLVDSRILVGSLRAIKSYDEIALLREAGQRSSLVHQMLMRQNLIGQTERQISNWIEAQFLLQDMQWPSYETIVGTGHRSTILHARATDSIVCENDLVLIDAGAEWKGYCADITRTLPAGKKFTQEQKFIYGVVLKAQKNVIAEAKPGTTLQQLHQIALESMSESLQTKVSIKQLMPHSTSHWIGLDVHDPCAYVNETMEDIKLKVGMCFTIEPGLYFNRTAGFEKYDGIGVRIEDDVVVTDRGCELLTSVQKEIDEIEQLRAIS